MKQILKGFSIGAIAILFTISCKNQDNQQHTNNSNQEIQQDNDGDTQHSGQHIGANADSTTVDGPIGTPSNN